MIRFCAQRRKSHLLDPPGQLDLAVCGVLRADSAGELLRHGPQQGCHRAIML
jgi:hypothetical protein